MSNGIKIPGVFIPGTTSGVVVDSKYVKGGYITVESIAERDRLLRESTVITLGTKVYVKNEDTEYVYAPISVNKAEFQNTTENTIKEVAKQGFVKESQVTSIVEDTAKIMVDDAVKVAVPSAVDKQLDAKLEVVAEDIAVKATEEAKKEAVKQVEQQIETDYVKDTKFTAEITPIKDDVNNLKDTTTEQTEQLQSYNAAINDNRIAINNVASNLITNYYNKSDIDSKMSGIYHYKGSVDTYADLPKVDVVVGDVYNVRDTGMNYAWTTEGWDELGSLFEADDYYTKDEVDESVNEKLTRYDTSEQINDKLNSKADKNLLDEKASKSELNDSIEAVKLDIENDLTYGEF